jgi:FAD/FMN-containing dehydrogenase
MFARGASAGLLLAVWLVGADGRPAPSSREAPRAPWRGHLASWPAAWPDPVPAAAAPTPGAARRTPLSRLRALAVPPFCEPTQACWPTPAQWDAFNASVGGTLLLPAPEGKPCVADPASPACAAVAANWTNASWRRIQPGAAQYPFYEADGDTGANCYEPGKPCAQGDVPPYGVRARSAADVGAALVFAGKHNLRVVVKSSGHDMQGRSSGKNALLIWLQSLSQLVVHDSPGGLFAACDGDAPTPAVTAQAGVEGGTVYETVGDKYTWIGGSARTVSAAGGHLLGGGHLFASPAYGLAVDNLLQAQVVLANGSVVTASPCSHPDLFWALRGGGGSTFGVVINATHRLHPNPPAGVTGVTLVVALLAGLPSIDAFFTTFLPHAVDLVDPAKSSGGVWGGYWYVVPVSATEYAFEALLAFNSTAGDAAASLAGFLSALRANPLDFYVAEANFTSYPSMNAFHDAIDPSPGETTGSWSIWSSRLVPAAAATDPARLANASLALAYVSASVRILGHLVVGGAVAQADPYHNLTSVTPAWRSALLHVVLQADFAGNATLPEIDTAFEAVSDLTNVLRASFPDSGAYWNEADALEPDWEGTFWGEANYPRLQQVKQAYDPAGRFSCWHCVALPAPQR